MSPGRSDAQTLKLRNLRVFPSDVVGPWVTYRVRTRSDRYPVREFTQRVAIVSRETVAGRPGFWVELKTVDPTRGTRIERGLFASAAPGAADDSSGAGAGGAGDGSATPLRLVRYQVLTPGGKLYEYPVESAISPRAEGTVASYELFEYDPNVRPERAFLGPDTLRIGRRVVPAVVERVVRVGSDDWPSPDDSGAVYRLQMTQLVWRNGAVPITGIARSLFRVTTVRAPAPADSLRGGAPARPDSALGSGARPDSALASPTAGATAVIPTGITPADTTTDGTALAGPGRVLGWTDVVLEDLGADATPEVTQEPEPAPESELQPQGPVR